MQIASAKAALAKFSAAALLKAAGRLREAAPLFAEAQQLIDASALGGSSGAARGCLKHAAACHKAAGNLEAALPLLQR